MIHYYIRKFFTGRTLIITAALLLLGTQLRAQPAGIPVLNFAQFATGLSAPVDIVNAGDGTNRLFIVQIGGVIRVHNGSNLLATPFINLTDTIVAGGEQGLLSMAFHPDYETNRYFFVWYTDKEGDLTLARYQTSAGNPNVADQTSEVVLLEIPKPGTPYFRNHNGGKLNFGSDGYLYISIGDGGDGGDPFNNSQNGNSLLGKMLRLNVNSFNTPPYYTVPPDNPYVSNPTVRDEIWAQGLRNPWRWSFDRLTNDMWIGDVGQGAREEVNFRAAGSTGGVNYGWRCYEGSLPYNTSGCAQQQFYTFPVFEYGRDNATGGRSITGGNVYRGPDYPLLTGWYITADYISGNVWKIHPNGSGGWTVNQQTGLPGGIAAFGEAENGALFAVGLNNGTIYSVQATTTLPIRLIDFSAIRKNGNVLVEWRTSYEEDLSNFEIEYSYDGRVFEKAGIVAPVNNTNGSKYSYTHVTDNSQKLFYRLKTIGKDSEIEYSRILALNSLSTEKTIVILPTVISNRSFTINTNHPLKMVQVIGPDGREVYKQALESRTGAILIQLPMLKAGTYLVHSSGDQLKDIQKIVIQ